jgi:nucleotide-binding universal stress UspA family protein
MRIVVGVDESPASIGVLEVAIREAAARDSELHVVSVFQTPWSVTALKPGHLVSASERTEYHERVWGRLRPLLESSHVGWETVELSGDPGHQLTDYVQNVRADLLVVGSRSRGDLASMVLGSTSHACLRLSPVNVLIIKPGSSTKRPDRPRSIQMPMV